MTSRPPGKPPRRWRVLRRHRGGAAADPFARLSSVWALVLDRFRNYVESGEGGTTTPRPNAGGDPDDLER